jgi:hypothetical protein
VLVSNGGGKVGRPADESLGLAKVACPSFDPIICRRRPLENRVCYNVWVEAKRFRIKEEDDEGWYE